MLATIMEARVGAVVAHPHFRTGLLGGFAANREVPFSRESPWDE